MQEEVSLKEFTTMKTGGKARFFVCIKSEEELAGALDFAKANNLSVFVLGGGSNVVVSDEGFDGLVIKNEISGISFTDDSDGVLARVGAGVDWDEFVNETTERHLWGVENLSFIPGTVGAAPVQNIGAYGVEVKDTISIVRAVSISTGEVCVFENNECQFSYRDSIFKQTREYVITEVEFKLLKNGSPNLSYKDLGEKVYALDPETSKISPGQMREVVTEIRKRKLPDPAFVPTAGSFFKNPEVTAEHYSDLLKEFPSMPGFVLDSGTVKIPLAWIIENVAKLKGAKYGGVEVYENHALVLVNTRGGRARDIFELANRVRDEVRRLTKIEIEAEVQFVGDF